ncbi:RNA 2',3'-cyclic phosphodiesterase [Meiothermus hypogaeus]|uniref:RNA 2',3'-cyclic phosphodiesterase n=2 Tax=Meiothermus hypogaeus TaxID=884155 RepID=A0A511R1T5_9DEIN|nr:RNA 2',3'-cyclic phosphodiesterase [Meiothermus hypogaeus]RIH77020.1 RNA 2',3'-cyclic phosphodiesterase [Meiothermus hypogaeus]GEM83575.1 RNA 2',3'-cyclic phosphodiesterase [Meiothermus hypogaeus NBRC 106114]
MRLFYAIFPPRAVQEALGEAQEKVRGFKGWKLSPPPQLHITLLFLGQQPEERLPEFRRIGREIAATVPEFKVELAGTGYFPPTGSPRVWFVKASGVGLEPLAQRLQGALPEIKAAAFHPHLTLARKKGPAPRIGPLVLNLQFQAKAVCLVESKLERSGSQYRVIEQFPLG